MPIVPELRSPYETVGGVVYFGRLIDKVRLFDRGQLPEDYHAALGNGQDKIVVSFLQLSYDSLKSHILAHPEASDEEILEWAYKNGRRLVPIDIAILNGFLTKRGWRDQATNNLQRRLAESQFSADAAETNFDYIELDEGRPARRITL